MSDMNLNMKEIMKNLEEKIKDEKDLSVAKVEIFNLYNAFVEEISNLNELAQNRMTELAMAQKDANDRMEKIEKILKKIENDIYMDEEQEEGEYTMEIVCPYCNKTFSVEMDEIAEKDEINCPECKNTIELDWGTGCGCDDCSEECEEDGCDCCDGHCHGEDEDDNF